MSRQLSTTEDFACIDGTEYGRSKLEKLLKTEFNRYYFGEDRKRQPLIMLKYDYHDGTEMDKCGLIVIENKGLIDDTIAKVEAARKKDTDDDFTGRYRQPPKPWYVPPPRFVPPPPTPLAVPIAERALIVETTAKKAPVMTSNQNNVQDDIPLPTKQISAVKIDTDIPLPTKNVKPKTTKPPSPLWDLLPPKDGKYSSYFLDDQGGKITKMQASGRFSSMRKKGWKCEIHPWEQAGKTGWRIFRTE